MNLCYEVTFFVFSFMPALVTDDKFIQIFVRWEGVGICFYLLVIFRLLMKNAAHDFGRSSLASNRQDFSLSTVAEAESFRRQGVHTQTRGIELRNRVVPKPSLCIGLLLCLRY